MGVMDTETRNVWVLVTRSDDEPGIWSAHCLDLDLVTQGETIEGAFVAARAAILMAVCDDLSDGLDPFDARSDAPEECWERLWRVLRHAVPLESVPAERRGQLHCVVGHYKLGLPKVKSDPINDAGDPWEFIPAAWQLAALESFRGPDSKRC